MARFFVDSIVKNNFIITGQDAQHISKSLRMKLGDEIVICDSQSVDHKCVIEDMSENSVYVKVIESYSCPNEPNVKITLYQALPKSDKMDMIIQKSVELGVNKIVPILTERCVSRPDEKSINKKIIRWQKIAEEAAKQSGRGIVPEIGSLLNLESAAKDSSNNQHSIVFYELYGKKIGDIINAQPRTVSVFIGPEGGFSKDEIELLFSCNVVNATLGRRILRTETASLAALSVIMYITGNM